MGSFQYSITKAQKEIDENEALEPMDEIMKYRSAWMIAQDAKRWI